MQHHTLPTPLARLANFNAPVGAESEARWAKQVPDTCLVFVHGFGGRAVATWGEFPDLAMANSTFAVADLIFLGYESRSRQAAYNTSVLFRAIKALAECPRDVLSEVGGPERPEGFEYKTIVLVGHSLGGALVRDLAMSAKQQGCAWAESLRLALFAPAHMGANVIGLAESALGVVSWFPVVQAGLLLKFPVLRDLREGSPYLTRLLTMANQIGVHCTTRAELVVQAQNDWVVLQSVFFQDPPHLPYANTDHRSCCKPHSPNFTLPVTDVASVFR